MIRWIGVLVIGFAMAATRCDEIDEAFDCQSVCSRYQDCYDADYDVGACRDNCRARAATDSSVKAAANICEACLDDMSCASATFNCASSCGSIVP